MTILLLPTVIMTLVEGKHLVNVMLGLHNVFFQQQYCSDPMYNSQTRNRANFSKTPPHSMLPSQYVKLKMASICVCVCVKEDRIST